MAIDTAKPASEHNEQFNDSKDVKEQPAEGAVVRDEQWLSHERRLVRKLDCTLMPVIWVLYLFNYLDRTAIA